MCDTIIYLVISEKLLLFGVEYHSFVLVCHVLACRKQFLGLLKAVFCDLRRSL
jgi:hypothetical protein